MSAVDHPQIGMAVLTGARYPRAPFSPPERYPEFGNSWLSSGPIDPSNQVYSLVREALFRHLGSYDPETKAINLSVLSRLGRPRRIVVKPNWVREQLGLGDCVTTHGSVLRPLIDYLVLWFGPDCEVTVGDIPLQSSDIEGIWRETGVDVLRDYYRGQALPVGFVDWRREKAIIDSSGFLSRREPLGGDARGYVAADLGSRSFLEAICSPESIFSVNDYEPGIASCFHRLGRHSYLVPQTVLDAELFVNVPKLKSHCKAGLTACMKNLIGINGEKGWIPHFRLGPPHNGGDEFPDRARFLMQLKSRVRNALQGRSRVAYHAASRLWKWYRREVEVVTANPLLSGGAWPGNDTLWRSILDLVKVITLSDRQGKLRESPQRQHLCVIDAIVCGEGEGPLHPSPKEVGMVLAASNPVLADWAGCHVAGFDWTKIPQLHHALELRGLWEGFPESPDSVCASWRGGDPGPRPLPELPVFPFRPPTGWAKLREAEAWATGVA